MTVQMIIRIFLDGPKKWTSENPIPAFMESTTRRSMVENEMKTGMEFIG